MSDRTPWDDVQAWVEQVCDLATHHTEHALLADAETCDPTDELTITLLRIAAAVAHELEAA